MHLLGFSFNLRHPCRPVLLQITIQTINCTFYLIPNTYVMTHDCAWFDPVVIWSGFIRCALPVLGGGSHSACAEVGPVPGKQRKSAACHETAAG